VRRSPTAWVERSSPLTSRASKRSGDEAGDRRARSSLTARAGGRRRASRKGGSPGSRVEEEPPRPQSETSSNDRAKSDEHFAGTKHVGDRRAGHAVARGSAAQSAWGRLGGGRRGPLRTLERPYRFERAAWRLDSRAWPAVTRRAGPLAGRVWPRRSCAAGAGSREWTTPKRLEPEVAGGPVRTRSDASHRVGGWHRRSATLAPP